MAKKLYGVNGGVIVVDGYDAYGIAGYETAADFIDVAAFKMRLNLVSIDLVNGWDEIDEVLKDYGDVEEAGYYYVSRYSMQKYWEFMKRLDAIAAA